jgi:hypothetical protein
MLHGVLNRLLGDVVKRRSNLGIDLQTRVHIHAQAAGETPADVYRQPVERRAQPARSTAEGFR